MPGSQLDFIPAGGVHLRLRMPERCSDADVAQAAEARGVTVNAGPASFPGEPPAPYLRLSYAAEDIPELRRGIEILAAIIGPDS
jgi:DNA-binding transcriptional MocR family regulator